MATGNIVIQVIGNGSVELHMPQGMDELEVQAYLLSAAFNLNGAVRKKASSSNIVAPDGLRVGLN